MGQKNAGDLGNILSSSDNMLVILDFSPGKIDHPPPVLQLARSFIEDVVARFN